jgi:hypothetical protein
MSIYRRYASREHDEEFFSGSRLGSGLPPAQPGTTSNQTQSNSANMLPVEVYPLNGQFNPLEADFSQFHVSEEDWLSVFKFASYFIGYDEVVFGNVVTMVFKNVNSNKLCTRTFTKYGFTSYDDLILDTKSRFWPACENLTPEYRQSKMRKALAISNLKNYSKLSNNRGILDINTHWDETNAGALACTMKRLHLDNVSELGCIILQLGLLLTHSINSLLLDVVYDKSNEDDNRREGDDKLIELLGDQIDQVFNPLLEYSPEAMDILYIPPETKHNNYVNSYLIESIIGELLSVQTNYTMKMVNLLQNFIIPLRINILDLTDKNGIAKLNKIFPPTTDEITRINCILHDALNRAHKYGFVEVFKVLGMILPYFYKPFIRHEANLKNFGSRLKRFHSKHTERVFENEEINKGGYNIREIDSIIRGSLLELPQLKLITKRLYETVIEDHEIQTEFPESVMNSMKEDYRTIVKTIDAFGVNDETDTVDCKSRVFTPTGKILTELASNWPAELQYGWLTRKVVDIIELKNVKPEDEASPVEILVIFSDHLLFLNIMDVEYGTQTNANKTVSVTDILMHSLVNQKPIPNISQFPPMKVSCWCNINDVLTTCYEGVSDSLTSSNYIKLVSMSKKGFSVRHNSDPIYSKSYQIMNSCGNRLTMNQNIITLINKSRILYKNQSLHLFKRESSNFCLYSAAHEMSEYELERSKSPFALFLNILFDNPREYLNSNADLKLLILANYVDKSNIQISAFGKANEYSVIQTIHSNKFETFVRDIVSSNYHLFMKFDKSVTTSMIETTSRDLAFVAHKYSSNVEDKNDVSTPEHKPEINELPPVAVEKEKKVITVNDSPKNVSKETLTQPKKDKSRRMSFLHDLLKPFKKHKAVERKPNKQDNKRNISNTFIPKGETVEVNHIYRPVPEITNAEEHDDETGGLLNTTPSIETRVESGFYKNKTMVQNNDVSSILKLTIETDSGNENAGISRKNTKRSIDLVSCEQKSSLSDNLSGHEEPKHASIYPEGLSKRNYASSIFEVDIATTKDELELPDVNLCSNQMQQFYSDGLSNWVTIIRDNSSLFADNMTKSIVKDKKENPVATLKVPQQVNKSKLEDSLGFSDSDDTLDFAKDVLASFGNDSFDFSQQELKNITNNGTNHFVKEKREASVQSLTPSMYASNLEKEMDHSFSTSRLMDTIKELDFSVEVPSYAPSLHSNHSTLSLESSDNDYYSSEEYNHDYNFEYHKTRNSIDTAESDSTGSSEATIINEQTNNLPTSRQISEKLDETPNPRVVSGSLQHINRIHISKIIGKLRMISNHDQDQSDTI